MDDRRKEQNPIDVLNKGHVGPAGLEQPECRSCSKAIAERIEREQLVKEAGASSSLKRDPWAEETINKLIASGFPRKTKIKKR